MFKFLFLVSPTLNTVSQLPTMSDEDISIYFLPPFLYLYCFIPTFEDLEIFFNELSLKVEKLIVFEKVELYAKQSAGIIFHSP